MVHCSSAQNSEHHFLREEVVDREAGTIHRRKHCCKIYTMSCSGGCSSIWPVARRVVTLLCVGFLVALAFQQGVANFQKQGVTTVDSYSSNSLSSLTPLHLQQNSQVSQLKGRTMGPKNIGTFRDIKRKVPNGPDPIHNRRAGKSGEPSGRQ